MTKYVKVNGLRVKNALCMLKKRKKQNGIQQSDSSAYKEWHLNAIQAAQMKTEQLRGVPVLTMQIAISEMNYIHFQL
jgi:hypothetical protein